MNDITEIDDHTIIDGLIKSCVAIHQSVAVKSQQFLAELSRHNYVTPTSYLELLGTFGKLLKLKITEVSTQRNRTKTGLDKVRYIIEIVYFHVHLVINFDIVVHKKCTMNTAIALIHICIRKILMRDMKYVILKVESSFQKNFLIAHIYIYCTCSY